MIDGGQIAQNTIPIDRIITANYSPQESSDLLTLGAVNALLSGLREKAPARVASTAGIDLSAGGLLTIDGIVLLAGDRVVVKDQEDQIENGVYIVGAGAWARAEDFDDVDGNDIVSGTFITVLEGETYAGSTFYVDAVSGSEDVEAGTDSIIFKRSAGVNGGTLVAFKPWGGDAGDGGTVYKVGTGVKYSGNYYVCNTDHVSSATFADDTDNWDNLGAAGSSAATTAVNNTGRKVITDATDQEDYNNKNDAALLKARNTAVVWGLNITQNGTDGVSVSAGEAQFLDNTTPSDQGYKPYKRTTTGDYTVSNLSARITWWYVDFADLTIKQTTSEPTLKEQVTKLLIGRSISDGTEVIEVIDERVHSQQLPLFVHALGRRIGRGRDSGLQFSASGLDTIQMGSGVYFDITAADETNFGFLDFDAQSPVTFLPSLSTGLSGAATSSINVDQYEDGEELVNAGANKWMVSLLYLFPSQNVVLLAPQDQWGSKTDAIENMLKVSIPTTFLQGALVGYVVYKKGADLSGSDAEVVNIDVQSINSNLTPKGAYVEIADIINSLTSEATDQPLAAAQGKALKALIDLYAQYSKPNITSITGLKALATVGLPDGMAIHWVDSSTNVAQTAELKTGTDAVEEGVKERPNDYNNPLNTRYWHIATAPSLGAVEVEKYQVSPDLYNVINPKYTTPVQISIKFFNGVSSATYRTRIDDGSASWVVRSDLATVNTYLNGLADGVDVEIEIVTNATKVTWVKLTIDRS